LRMFFFVRPIVLSLQRSTIFNSATGSSSNCSVRRWRPLWRFGTGQGDQFGLGGSVRDALSSLRGHQLGSRTVSDWRRWLGIMLAQWLGHELPVFVLNRRSGESSITTQWPARSLRQSKAMTPIRQIVCIRCRGRNWRIPAGWPRVLPLHDPKP
jgi:hypothetical protein